MRYSRQPNPHSACRSLLQKAVRRGQLDLVRQVYEHLMEAGQKQWLRARAYVVGFEECWPVFSSLPHDPPPDPLTILLATARSVKRKEAPALSGLAYALAHGDSSVLDGSPDDRHIRAVAHAISRPDEFWEWVGKQTIGDREQAMISAALRCSRSASWPWDKAMAVAAAHLTVTEGVPAVAECTKPPLPCPLWVGIDKHTEQGKEVLRRVAGEVGIEYSRLGLLLFYMEGGRTGDTVPSCWEEREFTWRMGTLGWTAEGAAEEWQRVRPILLRELERPAVDLGQHLLADTGSTQLQLL